MADHAPGLQLFELRWVCRSKEGTCWIRGLDADDAISYLEANAGLYGCLHEHPIIVSCQPTKIRERDRNGRVVH